MELASSPDCNIDRTFTSMFYFPQKVINTKSITKEYRNPIYLAKEYKKMIDSGQVKNQEDLEKLIGNWGARVTLIYEIKTQ